MEVYLAETLVFPSDLGFFALHRIGTQVEALVIGHPTAIAARRALKRLTANSQSEKALADDAFLESQWPESAGDDLVLRLTELAAGNEVDFGDVVVATEHLTPFQRRVQGACRAIPWGETLSYGEVAAAAGSPGAARAVGQVMAANRTPLIVPCHRVVASGGRLGGFSAPQGVALKRRLLRMECKRKASVPAEAPLL